MPNERVIDRSVDEGRGGQEEEGRQCVCTRETRTVQFRSDRFYGGWGGGGGGSFARV